jgi:hypothetical protein
LPPKHFIFDPLALQEKVQVGLSLSQNDESEILLERQYSVDNRKLL